MARLKSIPKRIRCPIEEGGKVEEIIDNFFIETKEYLEKKYPKNAYICEVNSFWFANENYFSTNKNDIVTTDEKIRYVLYADRIVAGVIERRTEWNHAEYIFFRDLSGLK